MIEGDPAKPGPRVKVYVLGEFADWEDYGVGNLSFRAEFNAEKQTTEDFLTVRTDRKQYTHQQLYPMRDREWLLFSRLDITNDYEKQEDTIIRWRDPELNEDLAVSFNDKSKCDEQWKILCEKIGKDHMEIANLRTQDQMDMPTEDNLMYILQTTINRSTTVVFHIINNAEFLSKLAQLARLFEQRSDEDGLRFLGRIVRTILNYHDTRIIEALFGSAFFETLLTVLKRKIVYDADADSNTRHLDYLAHYRERFRQRSLLHFDQVNTERILIINRIIFYIELILNPATEPSLEAYLNRTVTANYVELFSMMVCTGKLSELLPFLQTRLQDVLGFLSELINGLKVYTQGHEDIKWKVYTSFYDQKLIHGLVETAQLGHTSEAQLIRLLDIVGVVAVSAERPFLEFLRSTYSDDICITKLIVECVQHSSDNVRSSVANMLRQLVSEVSLRKEFSEFILSTVVFTVGEHIRKAKIEQPAILLKALTTIVGVCLNIIQFTECRTGKMFEKLELVPLMKEHFRTKERLIMSAQLVKLCMGRLEDKDKRDQKDKDPDLIAEVRRHDLVGTLIETFGKWHRSNNILTSTIRECFKMISVLKFKEFYKSVLDHQTELRRYAGVTVIKELLDQVVENEKTNGTDHKHQEILDDQKLEHYLNEADTKSPPPPRVLKREGSTEKHLESLRQLAEQIGRRASHNSDSELHFGEPKEQPEPKPMDITLNFSLDCLDDYDHESNGEEAP